VLIVFTCSHAIETETMTSVAVGRVLSSTARQSVRRQFSSLLALTEEYPGLPETTPIGAKASSPSVSTLSNGVIVVTEDACTTATVSLTFPSAGSSGEMMNEQGAALVNKKLAFNSGSGLSTMRILRSIEDDGGVPFVTAGRFGATLGYTCGLEKASRLVPLLATDCTFEKWDIKDAKKLATTELQVASSSAQVVLTEQIYAAAYGPQTPAGRPFYYSAPSTVSLDAIKSFRERTYGIKGAILAATGVEDHESFVQECEESLSESPLGTGEAAVAPIYLGGEARLAVAATSYTHVAMAFDSSSMSTPLANVVKQCLSILGAQTGVTSFASKGLVGVYIGGESSPSLIDSLCATAAMKVDASIVDRAKSLAKGEALFAADGGSQSLAAMMTAAVEETGAFTGVASIAGEYDAVTAKEVKEAMTAMIKKPSLAAVGDLSDVPYLGSISL